jgi:hypothetical protein
MKEKKTLGGILCPQTVDVYFDRCKKCSKHFFSINDQRVYEGCQCLKPQMERGMALRVETANIVDAIGVKFDQEKV